MQAKVKLITGLNVKSAMLERYLNNVKPQMTDLVGDNAELVLNLTNLGGTTFPVFRIVAVGASGRQVESIIALNGRTGRASVIRPQETFLFDSENVDAADDDFERDDA
jgi:hypothetical protein